jgi:hypothetical protein
MIEIPVLQSILDRHGRDPANVIAILQDIQATANWLPEESLRYVCTELEIPLSQMMALATFYKAFSLRPRVTCVAVNASWVPSSGNWASWAARPMMTCNGPWRRLVAWGPVRWVRLLWSTVSITAR